jgi:hypothetical protein
MGQRPRSWERKAGHEGSYRSKEERRHCRGKFGTSSLLLFSSPEELKFYSTVAAVTTANLKIFIYLTYNSALFQVGGVARWNWEEKWWERAFDSAAQTVDKDSSDSSDSDSDDDDEIDAAHIAAAISGGTPGASAGGAMNRDGTATTASRDELKLLNALTSSKSRVAAGRFGGRDAKMERIRAQEAKMAAEAAAKLGVPSTGTAPGGQKGNGSDRSDATSEAAGTLKADKSKKKTKKEKKKQSKKSSKKSKSEKSESSDDDSDAAEPEVAPAVPPVKKQRIVIEPQGLYTTDGPSLWNFVPTPIAGWWGASMFASAGCLDSMKKDLKASKRAEFTEDQQEKLYHAAHAGKTQGKVGLGQRSGPVKIGGVKWSGKKVAFEEEEEVVNPSSSSGSDEEEDADKKKKKEKKRKAELKAVGSSTGLDELENSKKKSKKKEKKKSKNEVSGIAAVVEVPCADWVSSIKWKKVLTKTLEAAPGRELKLKALHSAVTATVVEKVQSGSVVVSTEHVKIHVEKTIASSSKFIVEGKKVRLSGKS